MPLVDVPSLPILEPRDGWRGRFFHSEHMTFAYYAIAAGADVHVHHHEEEEVWHSLEGELELELSGTRCALHQGQAAVVRAGERHAVRAVRDSRVIVVDHPVRTTVAGISLVAADTRFEQGSTV